MSRLVTNAPLRRSPKVGGGPTSTGLGLLPIGSEVRLGAGSDDGSGFPIVDHEGEIYVTAPGLYGGFVDARLVDVVFDARLIR